MFKRYKINPHERGLLWRDGEFIGVLQPGVHWKLDPRFRLHMDRVATRDAWLTHKSMALIIRSGLLGDDAIALELADHQRALVWFNGRFNAICAPGRYVIWKDMFDVRVELVDAREIQFTHPDFPSIMKEPEAATLLEKVVVEPGRVAVVFHDGALYATLQPGTYAFWRNTGQLRVLDVDLREQVLDIGGQEIMTADKVTLRLNALVTYLVADPVRTVTASADAPQALYRAAQLALRELVGARELDVLLTSRDVLTTELEAHVRARAEELGLAVVSTGVRDVILPGDMKELLNRVTEAKKAAEAALVTRREETAAMRMQANTAKILEGSPTLMKLRELEVLEKVAAKANLTVVLGDGAGLSDRVVKLL
ncbi:MAG TPA: slipin family protein [Thermoanaerobaculia bacterium]